MVHGYQHGQDHIALDGGTHYTFVGETKNPGAGQVGLRYQQGGDTIVDGSDGKTHFEIQLQGFHGHLDASDFIAGGPPRGRRHYLPLPALLVRCYEPASRR